jgi:hypothetical protein
MGPRHLMLGIAGPTQKTLGRDPPLDSGHTIAAREATSWIDGRLADVQLAADLEQLVVAAADSRTRRKYMPAPFFSPDVAARCPDIHP